MCAAGEHRATMQIVFQLCNNWDRFMIFEISLTLTPCNRVAVMVQLCSCLNVNQYCSFICSRFLIFTLSEFLFLIFILFFNCKSFNSFAPEQSFAHLNAEEPFVLFLRLAGVPATDSWSAAQSLLHHELHSGQAVGQAGPEPKPA